MGCPANGLLPGPHYKYDSAWHLAQANIKLADVLVGQVTSGSEAMRDTAEDLEVVFLLAFDEDILGTAARLEREGQVDLCQKPREWPLVVYGQATYPHK